MAHSLVTSSSANTVAMLEFWLASPGPTLHSSGTRQKRRAPLIVNDDAVEKPSSLSISRRHITAENYFSSSFTTSFGFDHRGERRL
ncbi:MAG: hypothetical protein ACOY3V_07875, partial [Pseudomonadota bacterium]